MLRFTCGDDHPNRISACFQERAMKTPVRLVALAASCCAAVLALLAWSSPTPAMPAFARQYNVNCQMCHSAFPRLNAFGEYFAADNMRLGNWRDTMMDTGDDRLALPKSLPLAIRAQAFVQGRDAEEIDYATGPTGNDSSFDVQAPYLVKLLSSAPLSDNITYYFYGIFAEKGGNGEVIIEDAWFSYADIAGSDVSGMLGQFQVSDLMFPREVRLTFQDYYAYRAAGITYDRGIILDRGFGPLDVAVGLTNGNGIQENVTINSPGYRRPDHMFDNDSGKTLFGRIGTTLGPVNVGLFGLVGEQRSASGFAGADSGSRDTDKTIYGLDVSGAVGARTHWYAQLLWNQWDGFLDADPTMDYKWFGSFAGVDFIMNDRWALSLLYNYTDASDFDGTGTVFEGIDISSLTFSAAYYFMRNVKVVIELNVDLLSEDRGGPPYVGHQSKENYILVGFDAAY
jgi:hypothetical protein